MFKFGGCWVTVYTSHHYSCNCFIAGVDDTGNELSPVSCYRRFIVAGVIVTVPAIVVDDNGDKLNVANISGNFRRNWPQY